MHVRSRFRYETHVLPRLFPKGVASSPAGLTKDSIAAVDIVLSQRPNHRTERKNGLLRSQGSEHTNQAKERPYDRCTSILPREIARTLPCFACRSVRATSAHLNPMTAVAGLKPKSILVFNSGYLGHHIDGACGLDAVCEAWQ